MLELLRKTYIESWAKSFNVFSASPLSFSLLKCYNLDIHKARLFFEHMEYKIMYYLLNSRLFCGTLSVSSFSAKTVAVSCSDAVMASSFSKRKSNENY